MLRVSCPNCDARLKVSKKHIGKRLKCPRCGSAVVAADWPEPGTRSQNAFGAAPSKRDESGAREEPSADAPGSTTGVAGTRPAGSRRLIIWGIGAAAFLLLSGVGVWLVTTSGDDPAAESADHNRPRDASSTNESAVATADDSDAANNVEDVLKRAEKLLIQGKANNEDESEERARRAMKLVRPVLEQDPENYLALSIRSIAWNDLGATKAAGRDAGKALKIDPERPEAHVAQALFFLRSNEMFSEAGPFAQSMRVNVAENQLKKAVELGVNPDWVVVALTGFTGSNDAELKNAKDVLDAVLAEHPNHYQLLAARALVFSDFEKLRPDQALNDAEAAIKLDPDRPQAYVARAGVRWLLEDRDAAVDDYRKAVDVDPDYGFARVSLAEAYKFQSRFRSAIRHYDYAIEELEMETADLYFARGECFHALKKHDEAIDDYTEALDWNPDDYRIWDRRALVYREVGKHTKAASDQRKALSLVPDDFPSDSAARGWYGLGISLGKLGRTDEALEAYARSIGFNPTVEAWHNRGNIYLKSGRYRDAVREFTEALRIQPHKITYEGRSLDFSKNGSTVGSGRRHLESEPDAFTIEQSVRFAQGEKTEKKGGKGQV